MKPKLVVIGNGMAPGRVLDVLFETDSEAFEVTIFNAEPRVNYDRIQLSPVLAGEKSYADIVIHDDSWYAGRGITLHKGKPVIDINRAAGTVTAVDGTVAHYDKLLIATGSRPIMPPLPGMDLPGVVTYRDLDDVDLMCAAAARGGHAVVVGGGLLGLEAAAGLIARGMRVTVLHLAPTLMERQLDTAAGYLLETALRERDITVITEANTIAVLGDTQVTGVALADGREIAAELVVFAIGIRPNTTLAAAAGLAVGRGIQVGDDMRTFRSGSLRCRRMRRASRPMLRAGCAALRDGPSRGRTAPRSNCKLHRFGDADQAQSDWYRCLLGG